MNRPEHQHLRRRADGRRRVGAATGWAAAAGGGLTAVFGVLLAQSAPAAAASPAPADAAQVQPAIPAPAPVHHHHRDSSTAPLQPPAGAPVISSGGGSHGVSGSS